MDKDKKLFSDDVVSLYEFIAKVKYKSLFKNPENIKFVQDALFGATNEPTLVASVDNAKGSVVIKVFTEKAACKKWPVCSKISKSDCTRHCHLKN